VVINEMAKKRAAVFLDRDGVLNRSRVEGGRPFPPRSSEEFQLFPETAEACAILARMGPLIVVTNQPDVGRGTMNRKTVERMHANLYDLLPISRIEVCYEDGHDVNSQFYKPAPGMLIRAAQEMNLDLQASVMIGDRWRDIDCGRAAGCLTIWIDRGYSEELHHPPDYTVRDLLAAARLLEDLGLIPKELPHENSA
jgi:D-glycero-D-manno-heptose 1,7-bisphosphate phosphatase